MNGFTDSAVMPTPAKSLSARLSSYNWEQASHELTQRGATLLGGLLREQECAALISLYDEAELYRSKVIMARHGFGQGEYQYFRYPLPHLVSELRGLAYPYLAPVANQWNAAMNLDIRYPEAHQDFIARCHNDGQTRPTPLILQYQKGDYNCLHQDLYGEHVFPLQLAVLLSAPERDFSGGEFVLTEQRPRMQSRAEVVPLRQGDGVIFAVHHRPVRGVRGVYRVTMRHGVSRVRSGRRYALGVIFHDAKG
ncbi:proline hydroxylase [Hahella sp. KA22]|uniref:2OG-Fe(II) oxygenase n=1 Tax=Hahella sp. KA22 TaxID=1628392 RepID=UPI000FDEAACA|nr:2OG-Fe(II) oxygenase [Hahella sp. KA22]AZZ94118.1 proline hydroxylase [Hahella sp. KA22]QAY57492.1 proline hydroxylase [Hahella sp. KA22]